MEIITTKIGIEMLLRWGHFLAGITWVGLLYYFNFVQTEYLKEAEAAAKTDVLRKLAPRALWWFRWSAAFTFATGVGIMGMRGPGMPIDIYVGALLGTLMFLNVWLIIWPNQKIVIASAEKVASGGAPLPEATEALATAGLVSRTNALFSIPMLFFMGASAHFAHPKFSILALLIVLLIVLILQYNAAYKPLSRFAWVRKLPAGGKMGPLAKVSGVIHLGLALTMLLYLILELFAV
jgi:uncharacterized membrane protein